MKPIISHLSVLFAVIVSFTGYCACNKRTKQLQVKTYPAMNDTFRYANQARRLVEELKEEGITDERVLDVLERIPRHRFVEKEFLNAAYVNKPLPIGMGQTISQPYTVAYQTHLLGVKPGEKVLEIGTGSGYQAAVLCEMGAEVYSIERVYALYVRTTQLLSELGYSPGLFFGDGYEGLPQHAPFDKILITAAAKEPPPKLLYQLRVGGWMVVPVSNSSGEEMKIIKRITTDQFTETAHGLFRFVPMKKGIEK